MVIKTTNKQEQWASLTGRDRHIICPRNDAHNHLVGSSMGPGTHGAGRPKICYGFDPKFYQLYVKRVLRQSTHYSSAFSHGIKTDAQTNINAGDDKLASSRQRVVCCRHPPWLVLKHPQQQSCLFQHLLPNFCTTWRECSLRVPSVATLVDLKSHDEAGRK